MTVKQIDGSTNIDRMDSADRAKLDPRTKLKLMLEEGRQKHGGVRGCSIVGRPRVILQLLLDLDVKNSFSTDVRLQTPMVYGTSDSDVVGWHQDIAIRVRSSTVGDNLRLEPTENIPPSHGIDRRQAGRLRMAAHSGKLDTLREQEN